MIYYLLTTAFAVSADSFICGFSLYFNKTKKVYAVAIIALTVFVMCLFTNYAAVFFAEKITEKSAAYGGFILLITGTRNLFPQKNNTPENLQKKYGDNAVNIRQSMLTGFAVGLDGAVANLSLALMGINSFYVPLTIAAMHALMVYLGTCLADAPFIKKAEKLAFIPPLALIALGLYKLSGLFV